ncbi:hypothetical protein CROQUDRAFT_38898 [Cronartium quercuum f. sp. fusiforme G11]|uniref:Protein kinase domain-containing protein n=1 Tax=Cronartium quercuum f. sp. fusiforme G11 TaxID=708437 RepID=A0A9P6NQB2_9BASI|nr:hypothetical protein CROQUDRAFT_38898 [Cronartium quercuum f. sp. fusiforme G11]
MKRLRHRHIVQLMEVIDDAKSKKVFMILEFMEGGQVKWQDELKQTPLMTVEQARRTFRQVLLGLEYLHYQGIIHRDIKPANLLWTADRETVKISDFGVSHLSGALKRSSSSANLSSLLPTSATGVVAPMSNSLDDQALRKTEGSPAFMAPELCCPLEATPSPTPAEHRASDYFTTRLSQSPIDMNDERVISHPLPPHTFPPGERPGVGKGIDIWALGVTLFCLLFGQTPFKAPNEYELFNVIWYEAVAVPEAMGIERATTEDAAGRQLVDLLGRLLRKDPRQRIRLEDVKVFFFSFFFLSASFLIIFRLTR